MQFFFVIYLFCVFFFLILFFLLISNFDKFRTYTHKHTHTIPPVLVIKTNYLLLLFILGEVNSWHVQSQSTIKWVLFEEQKNVHICAKSRCRLKFYVFYSNVRSSSFYVFTIKHTQTHNHIYKWFTNLQRKMNQKAT